jgi:peptide/nickel transport system ATP-binding protein
MYAGRIVEIGPVADVIHAPAASLHGRLDGLDPRRWTTSASGWRRSTARCRASIAIPYGCAFHPRCAERAARVPRAERPDLVSGGQDPVGLLAAGCRGGDRR